MAMKILSYRKCYQTMKLNEYSPEHPVLIRRGRWLMTCIKKAPLNPIRGGRAELQVTCTGRTSARNTLSLLGNSQQAPEIITTQRTVKPRFNELMREISRAKG